MYTLNNFLNESGKAEAPNKIKTFEDFVNRKVDEDDEEETEGGEDTLDAVQSEKDKKDGETSAETQHGDDIANTSADSDKLAADVAKDVEKKVAADDAKADVKDTEEEEIDAEEIVDDDEKDDDDEEGED
jgi:hypothetical protein